MSDALQLMMGFGMLIVALISLIVSINRKDK
ncbi:putative holin-like toxin [Marinilactibacillus psychrotolerans]|uniref:Holin-like toxin n=1 Tax=Marinilactibacillus psychrotolerans TaxID=191770 RepID=A0ABW8UG94_9LACT|nr:putative holin-like toxin [Marinilactibacillus psychrotolerans]